ncbi:MAG: AAA family ATPase, partial [Candidatus Sericytochromatia bacterium]|nr:AAA family ATPase [Candidatus Tanganyikabacteria bacterium]
MDKIANRYRLQTLLGEGGMAKVYLAADEAAGRDVALKALGTGAAPEAVQRFRQEFWTMTQVRHPHLVEAYDFGTDPHHGPFFTMEAVEGESPGAAEPRPMGEISALAEQLLAALSALHERGLVHGDIKPDNLRVTPAGRLVLLDLGLAAQAGRSGAAAFGTLAYMAPEVLRKGLVDHRADLYGVGVLLYRLLTGRLPFDGGTEPAALIRAVLAERPVAPARLRPDLEPAWDAAVLRLLAKDPADRFGSCADLATALGLAVAAAGPPMPLPGHARFLGRDAELAILTDRLGSLLAGGASQHLAIVGSPGSGKTRLVDEFRTRVQLAEAQLFSVRCRPDAYPYQPFADLLRLVLPLVGEDLAEGELSGLARLLPELGAGTALPALDPDEERIRLQGAAAEALRAAARRRGSVFVLEGYEHADAASRDLLRLLLRGNPDAPWLWILTSGQSEEFGTPFREVALAGLPRDATAAVAASLLGGAPVPEPVAARLQALTGGTPGLLEAVVGHWARSGVAVWEAGAWRVRPDRADADLPDDLRDLALARTRGLDEAALEVAAAAAVCGQEFALEILAAALGESPDRLFPRMLDLAGAGIVEAVVGGSFRFLQGATWQALYDRVPVDRRRELHTAAARALEAGGGDDLPLLAAIARHHLAGTDEAAAIQAALAAGTQALGLLAVHDAQHLLGSGFARAMANGAPPRLELRYRQAMGDLCRLTARLDAAREHYDAGMQLARSLDDQAATATCAVALARVHQMRHENAEARARFGEAIPACRAAGDAAGLARCLLSLARIAHFEGDSTGAVAHAREALAVAEEGGVLPLVANARCFLGLLLTTVEPRKEVDGLALLEQSADLARKLGDRYQLNESTLNLGNVQLALGDFPGARASFESCVRYCQEMGAASEEVFALVSLAQVLVEMGRAAEALPHAEAASHLARSQGRKFPLAFALAMEAHSRLFLGELGRARTQIEDALEIARAISNRYVELLILGSRAEIQTWLGDWEGARATLAAARDLMVATANTEPELKLAILDGYLGALLLESEEPLRKALDVALRKHSQGLAARAMGYLAQLARRDGRLEEARQLAYEAGSVASEVHLVHVSGEMALLLGDLTRGEDRHEAYDYYFAALESGDLLRNPLLRALALHGLSETAETTGMAVNFWEQAVTELRKLVAPLASDDRERFLRYPERRAVHADRPALAPAEDTVTAGHLHRLTRFAAALSRQGSLEKVLELALGEILDLAGADRGFLLLYDGLELESRVIAARSEEVADLETFSSTIAKQVLWTGEPIYLVDALADERFSGARSVMALDLRTVLCLPLMHAGDVLGVIYVDSQAIQEPLAQPDLEVALALAQQAAGAIAGA